MAEQTRADRVLDDLIATTTPSDPDAPTAGEVRERDRQQRDGWHRSVDNVRPHIEDTPSGRRLRRLLDRTKTNADRLVRAREALDADLHAIREAAEAVKEDRRGQSR